jgi:hypothetical protein
MMLTYGASSSPVSVRKQDCNLDLEQESFESIRVEGGSLELAIDKRTKRKFDSITPAFPPSKRSKPITSHLEKQDELTQNHRYTSGGIGLGMGGADTRKEGHQKHRDNAFSQMDMDIDMDVDGDIAVRLLAAELRIVELKRSLCRTSFRSQHVNALLHTPSSIVSTLLHRICWWILGSAVVDPPLRIEGEETKVRIQG